MRALIICPFTRTVSDAALGSGLSAIYAALSHGRHRVQYFDCVGLGGGETLYLDDEGLLYPGLPLWKWSGASAQYAGRGLILGTNDEGDSEDSTLTVPEVVARLVWLTELETSGHVGQGREVYPPDGFDFAYQGGAGITQPAGTHAAELAEQDA